MKYTGTDWFEHEAARAEATQALLLSRPTEVNNGDLNTLILPADMLLRRIGQLAQLEQLIASYTLKIHHHKSSSPGVCLSCPSMFS